jgi:hypothetical protein
VNFGHFFALHSFISCLFSLFQKALSA